MEELDERIGARIDAFVADITHLVREATLERIVAALEMTQDAASSHLMDISPGSRISLGRRTHLNSGPGFRGDTGHGTGGRAQKRTHEEIESQCAQILDYIHRHPGHRAETIAACLGTSTKGVTFALKKLLANQLITRKCRKRATQYYPVVTARTPTEPPREARRRTG
jgi:hypothetical protein